MEVHIVKEHGYKEALFGLGLSYELSSDFNLIDEDIHNYDWIKLWRKLDKVAQKLAKKDGGHNKFLESIVLWVDIDAPRYWWSEFDTYRVGTTKQSESTMHTITKRVLTPDDFETPILDATLDFLNELSPSFA